MQVVGSPELDRALAWMAKESPSVMTAGMGAYLRTSVKAVKQLVPSKFRTSFAHRFNRKARETERKAMFGAGVGPRGSVRNRSANRPGVGISKYNIHWLVLGTGQRSIKPGANRGAMPAIYPDVVRRGEQSSRSAALNAMILAARKRIEQKAQQVGRR